MAMDDTRGAGFVASNQRTLEILNNFLNAEISAVETYRQALEKIDDVELRATLDEGLESHETRAAKLRDYVLGLGGVPSEGSGAWGSFARLIEGGAKVLGTRAAIGALEEGEDHGLELYREHLAEVDTGARNFVERELLSEQERTHAMLSAQKHSLH